MVSSSLYFNKKGAINNANDHSEETTSNQI